MATLTISLSGSALVNGSKSYTISDADVQSLLDWATVNYASALPLTPTDQQILLAWVQGWINATKVSVQQFKTPPAVVPPQISIT
jgi:hypothetical protein